MTSRRQVQALPGLFGCVSEPAEHGDGHSLINSCKFQSFFYSLFALCSYLSLLVSFVASRLFLLAISL